MRKRDGCAKSIHDPAWPPVVCHSRSCGADLRVIGWPAHGKRYGPGLAAGNRPMGYSTSPGSFDGGILLDRSGAAMDLSRRLGIVVLCHVSPGWLWLAVMAGCCRVHRDNLLAAAARFGAFCRIGDPSSPADCVAHCPSCRHVYRGAVRHLSHSVMAAA